MSTVVVLGSANMDLVVRQHRRPLPGETIFGKSFVMGAGGKGLNQAIAAQRAGASVEFVGAVGSDAFGDELSAFLTAEGVGTAQLTRLERATGTAHIAVTDDGENSIVVVPDANASTDFSDTDRAVIASAGYLIVQGERPAALVVEAMMWAREHGVITVFTPAPVPAATEAERLVALADIIVPNAGEALELTGESDPAAAARALAAGVRTAIVTLGGEGAVVVMPTGDVHHVAARPVEAVDTTGAGDTFVGALVAWLAAGAGLLEAVDAATAAASLSVQRPGAAPAMPTRAEIDAVLRS